MSASSSSSSTTLVLVVINTATSAGGPDTCARIKADRQARQPCGRRRGGSPIADPRRARVRSGPRRSPLCFITRRFAPRTMLTGIAFVVSPRIRGRRARRIRSRIYDHEYLVFFEHHLDEVDPGLEGGRALAQPDLDAPHRESLQDRPRDRAGQRFDQVVLAGVGRGFDPGEDRAVIDRLVEGVGAGRSLEIAPECDIGLARLREASLARTHADPGPELDTGQGDPLLPLTARHRNLPLDRLDR